jgi:hypothetical protein
MNVFQEVVAIKKKEIKLQFEVNMVRLENTLFVFWLARYVFDGSLKKKLKLITMINLVKKV